MAVLLCRAPLWQELTVTTATTGRASRGSERERGLRLWVCLVTELSGAAGATAPREHGEGTPGEL